MNTHIWALIPLAILVTSCKDRNKPTVERFVSGDLSIGITKNGELKTVFDTLNAMDLKIAAMHGFVYNANLPADSLHSLQIYLNTKPYINTGGWSASVYYHEPDRAIRIVSNLFEMDSSNQMDFLYTIDSLQLVDKQSDTKAMVLKVPIGQEKYWLNELKKQSVVKWAELNRILPD